jgi:hypothetical protein
LIYSKESSVKWQAPQKETAGLAIITVKKDEIVILLLDGPTATAD